MAQRIFHLLAISWVADGTWVETINQAGMQRTLSQMMTKEFLLISRGSQVSVYKAKLLQSMDSFSSTLNALRQGDAARGIIAAPNSMVLEKLDAVEAVWNPMAQLLRNNMDTVRSADGSIDMPVLEELSRQNVPLLDTSNEVVQAIVIAAQVSGATTNGLVQDIAGRQRTLIQRLAKGILFLAQGVAMSFNMVAYRDTKNLFEASHDGIIEGVPFAGLPVLNKLCTIHQMSEVSYFYAQLRPLLTGITNADTPSKSQTAADEVAEEVVDLVDPLYLAMVEAVKLYGDDLGACDPVSSMTAADWNSYFTTLSHQQLWTTQASVYFVQVALGIDVKTSQVEITVLKSEATLNLRRLIEGSKINGIPPPPSQLVVDHLLQSAEIWNTLESELDQGVHQASISEVTLARVEFLSHKLLDELEKVMAESIRLVNSSSVPAYAMDLAEELARIAAAVVEEACLIHHNHAVFENWQHLNASREAFASNRWILLHGAPATATTPAVDKVRNVCIVQQMKHATDLFGELERKALAVAQNKHDADINSLVHLSPTAVSALNGLATSLAERNGSCHNSTLRAEQWMQLHQQLAEMGNVAAELSVELVLFQQGMSPNQERLLALLYELDASLTRVMFGSYDPPVPAPPDQSDFDHLLLHMEPTVRELQSLASSSGNVMAGLAAEELLMQHAGALQEHFLEEALAMDPTWPGTRVDLALRQKVLARQVMKEAVLVTFDLRADQQQLLSVTAQFEAAHASLRDGGHGIPAIMLPERQDLLDQWGAVSDAWNEFKQEKQHMTADKITKVEASLERLVSALQSLVPLLSEPDVKDADEFPWAVLIYSTIGTFFCCCCGIICCRIQSKKGKDGRSIEGKSVANTSPKANAANAKADAKAADEV